MCYSLPLMKFPFEVGEQPVRCVASSLGRLRSLSSVPPSRLLRIREDNQQDEECFSDAGADELLRAVR